MLLLHYRHLACIFFTLTYAISYAAITPVGAGGYTTVRPTGELGPTDYAGNPVTPAVTPEFSQVPITHKWWSSVLWKFNQNPYSENLFANPLFFHAFADGLALGYATEYTVTPEGTDKGHPLQEYHFSDVPDLKVGLTNLQAASTQVARYGDWDVTLSWRDASNTNTLEATIGRGLPFAYFIKTGNSAQITPLNTPTIWYNNNGVLGITINNHHYGIFGPAGSTWSTNGIFTSDLSQKNYFSLATLPDNTPQTLEFYRKHAYAFVTNTNVSWNYNQAQSTVTTTFTVSTNLQENPNNTNNNQPLLALYRHQWLNTPQTLTNYSYTSPRGLMKVFDGSTFTTVVPYTGVVPTIPKIKVSLDGYNQNNLKKFIDEIYTQDYTTRWSDIPLNTGDTYWVGKALWRVAALISLADQVQHTQARDLFLAEVKQRLESWLSGTGPTKFYYDTTWKTLIGYPASYDSNTELNDHHFHYGYFIMAAAQVARYEPKWALETAWGGMINQLIKDVNNPDRQDTQYPFMRFFDAYEGHSWSNGPSLFAAGNNQESSSESLNFATGLILWGSLTGNKTLCDMGIYLYSTETIAREQYWFNVDNAVFPPEFNKPYAAIVWGNGAAYAIWWSGYAEELHGINLLPITGGSLNLARIKNYLREFQTYMYTHGGGNDVWRDIHMEAKALYDPQAALADLNQPYTPETGESPAHTYHWVHYFDTYGTPNTSITANIPTYFICEKQNIRTYNAYNPTAQTTKVVFSDGTTIANIAPRSFKTIQKAIT